MRIKCELNESHQGDLRLVVIIITIRLYCRGKTSHLREGNTACPSSLLSPRPPNPGLQCDLDNMLLREMPPAPGQALARVGGRFSPPVEAPTKAGGEAQAMWAVQRCSKEETGWRQPEPLQPSETSQGPGWGVAALSHATSSVWKGGAGRTSNNQGEKPQGCSRF